MKILPRVALSLGLTGLLLLVLATTLALAAPSKTANINNSDLGDEACLTAVTADSNAQLANGNCAINGSVLINELDADQTGTDAAEFIELYDGGAGNTALDGLVLVLYNGSSDTSYQAFDLDGQSTSGSGYFVLCGDAANVANCDLDVTPDTNLIQNGADAAALYADDDTSFPTGTAVTTTNLIDAIVYDTNDADDTGLLALLNPGQPQVNEGSNNSTLDSNQRCPDGGGGTRNTDTYIQATPTSGTTNNCPAADVTVTKSGPSVAQPGNTISYTILYENIGALDALNVVLTDTLPASYVSYIADDSGLTCPACNPGATGTLTWTVGPLSSTDSFSFTLVTAITNTVPFGQALTNTLAIGTSSSETNSNNNSAQWVTNISTLDLSVSKDGPSIGFSNEPLVYTITVANQGVGTAVNTILTDTLPISSTYVADDSGYSCPACIPGASGTLTWTVGNVPSNTITTFNLTVTADITPLSMLLITNSASISTDTFGDDTSNNSDNAITTIWNLVPIATARAGNNGDVFAVRGNVTYVPGTYSTNGWGFQDNSGGIAAFYSPPPTAALGDDIVLVATRGSFNGEEQFTTPVLAFDNLGAATPVAPMPYSTADVAAGLSEGWLVVISGTISNLTCPSTFNHSFNVDDGSGSTQVFVDGTTGVDVCDLGAENGRQIQVTGFSTEFNGTFQVKPRFIPDVIVTADAPIVSKSAPGIVGLNELYTYTLTVENYLGYDLTGVAIADIVPSNATFAYALDGGSTIVSGTDTVVNWTVPVLANQSTVDVRFAVTSTNVISQIVNEFYGMQAANYPTITLGSPITTVASTPLRIHDIQGESHFSPYEGLILVDTPGIVTVVRGSSFYMQDPNPDGSNGTSEGINVFTGSSPNVSVGDFVLVTGQIVEFYPGGIGTGNLPTTQISNPTVVVSSTGNALPPATIIGVNGRIAPNMVIDDDGLGTFDADADGIDFYESLEGMLVQVEDGLVVGSKRFGEIHIVADNGLNATGLNARGGIVISEDDFNPERIIIDDAIVFNEPFAEVGYAFTNIVTGVMDYSFGNFKLLNSQPLPPLTPGGLVSETSTLSGTADQLTAASFNVLNLDPGDSTFTGLADTIVNHLNVPDIIGLQEIQDNNGQTNDGTTDASQTYGTLITAIANAGGPTYEFRDIAPLDNMDGGAPGGNIRVGFLFRPDRVTFVDRPGGDATTATTPQLGVNGVELTFSPGRIEPTNNAFTDSRKPLAGEFIFNNQTIFVVNNHFNSKGGDDPLFGFNQPPVLHSEVQRLEQAQVVHDFVASIQAIDPNANIIVLGDLNDFQFSPPLVTLQDGVLTNLMDTLPASEQYTYIFDGNSQILDHILASDNLAANAEVDAVHVNAEFDASRRASDHDPVLSRFVVPFVPDVAPTAVNLTGPSTGTINTAYTFDANVLPLSTTLPITFTWAADEQAGSSQLLLSLTDAISYSWATTGTKTITVTATNSFGSVNAVHTIDITVPDEPDIAPTAVTLTGPTTGSTNMFYTFDANVLPLSTTLPITFTWAADEQAGSSQLRLSLTDAISYSWATTGTKTITVTATNSVGSVNAVHTIIITAPVEPPPPSYDLYLPFITQASGTAAAGDIVTVPSTSGLAMASISFAPLLLAFGWKPMRRLTKHK